MRNRLLSIFNLSNTLGSLVLKTLDGEQCNEREITVINNKLLFKNTLRYLLQQVIFSLRLIDLGYTTVYSLYSVAVYSAKANENFPEDLGDFSRGFQNIYN